MTLVVDAGLLVALGDQADPNQAAIEQLLRTEPGALILPALVSAEADYMIGRRLGRRARLLFLDDLAADRFMVECLGQDEHELVARLDRQYERLDLGLADLSVVVLAQRFRTRRVLTFDERHFRAMRALCRADRSPSCPPTSSSPDRRSRLIRVTGLIQVNLG